ncbi:Hsp20 family protein [secondary endosymbiont of Ctenarytaina eucalypti]|uniref:Molecular chaperone (Small heat shock protein) n=1 Tax=secondary endosymbiont of Ctenarytaina eucalypti TaxID=1199245 RepID=J3Z3Y7_9ENTR|nr:Hsp20 family protein [secondary endosymbiont of Ctenarytaina eucalypti]AFP84959.1 molecular chaperone (small heat shock protein) [secondary endosymbiont of Ctenarytaina eucalypti]
MAYRSFSLIPTLSNHLLSDRFTQIDNLFSRLTGASPVTDTPAYNLLKKNKEHYEITVSVPGYTQDELNISLLNKQLTISGKPKVEETAVSKEQDGIKWVHQGIRKHDFSLGFNLEHRISIHKASIDKGLLTVQFTYDIPEQEKPKKIAIGAEPELARVIEHHAK